MAAKNKFIADGIILILLITIGIWGMIYHKNADLCKKRMEFIKSYGWIVDEKSVIMERVKIPEEFDIIFLNYNDVQKKSGFNLENFKGKTLKRYTYSVKNHEDKYAVLNIFEYKGKIAAADVLSPALDGHLGGIDERTYQNAS